MLKTANNNNLAFKCTWNDNGFKGVCSQRAYQYNLSKNRAWCLKAPCRTFEGQPTDEDHPCYESILFTEWRFGAGWDHKNQERPREIRRAQVGKIVLLTTLEPDKEENERKIIGFFRVSKIDKGEEQETIVYGDTSCSLEIDSRITVNFWDYYANPNVPDNKRWGTGLFRYVDDSAISTFLKNLKKLYIKNNLSVNDIHKIDKALTDLGDVPSSVSLKDTENLEKEPAIPDDDKKMCNCCGHINSYKAKFCNECGKGFNMISQCNPEAVRDKLLEYGNYLNKQDRGYYFTPDKEADKFILEDSNAFLFAVIFDQGIGAEKAWTAPYEIKRRMGHLDVDTIAGMSEEEIGEYLQQKPKLHRFWPTMARRLKKASIKIQNKYNGDARNIWRDTPDSILAYERLKDFDGIGQKKASMAVNILYRDLEVKFRNQSGIDVSYDEMVRRIFLRTGIVKSDTINNVVKAARQLNPEYPGELDYPAWYIGRTWCLPKSPKCSECYLKDVCQKNTI